jgi:hypothetical protein
MVTAYKAAPDIEVLTSNFPIPGFGFSWTREALWRARRSSRR